MAFTVMIESDADEAARLAGSPAGSTNERCSHLPVTIPHPAAGMVIELPQLFSAEEDPEQRRVVVTVLERRSERSREPSGLLHRDGAWLCLPVASTDPRYPAGGYTIVVDETRLRRGRQVGTDQLLTR